jgi:hypothetical protein
MLHGLAFRREVEFDELEVLPAISDSYAEFMRGAYKRATLGRRYYRAIGEDPVRSSSTHLRVSINETIDASVFERWRTDENYRPSNLTQWAGNRKVELAQLRASVRADDAQVLV